MIILSFLWRVGNEKVSKSESLQYFLSRPRGSQLGAWASAQSNIIPSRIVLESAFEKVKRRFANGEVEETR